MTTKTKSNLPTHDILHVKGDKRKGEKVYYTKIGAAWAHEDQGGLNLQLDFIPRTDDGRLIIRLRKDAVDAQGEEA